MRANVPEAMRKPRTAKPALSLWLVDNSDRLGLTPADVAKRVGVSESTVRGWEAGRSIGPDSITGLERLFGQDAPDHQESGSQSDLIRALTVQTAAINALVDEMRLARERDQDAAAAMVRAAEVLLQSRPPATVGASREPGAPLGTT